MTSTPSVSGALAAIEELRIDSKIGKSKHFNASDRKMLWHRVFGVPVILANLFVGIVLVNLQGAPNPTHELPATNTISQSTPNSTDHAISTDKHEHSTTDILGIISIFLAFGAASLSGIQTFFNFYKAAEGHRAIGNRYVHISRQCKALQQKHRDIPYTPQSLWDEYQKLYTEYNQTNTEAESFTTSASDLEKAKTATEISPYKPPQNTAST